MNGFRVTYEIVTPESAEIGDAEERGFVAPGEWRGEDPAPMGLRQAMFLCAPQENCGRWWTEVDGRNDYKTGANEVRAIHPPANITDASYARVSRLLGVR